MNFTTLTEEEYRTFTEGHPQETFHQSYEMGEVMETRGWTIDYVGVKDEEGNVLASALLSSMPIRFGRFFQIDGGAYADYSNAKLVECFTNGLKEFTKAKGGLYLEMKPSVPYRIRNFNGEIDPKEETPTSSVEHIIQAGFQYEPAKVGFDTGQWIFIKNLEGLDEKSLIKSYQKDGIYSVKKTNQFGIHLRDLPYEELNKFQQLTEHTANRRGFHDKNLEYYQMFYKKFGDKARFVVAEINFQTYIDNLKKREAELQAKLDRIASNLEKTPNSSKMLNQQKEFQSQMATQEKRIQEAEVFLKEDGNQDVILAGGLFVYNQKEVVYLFSGTYDKYKNFYAPFLIQHEIMKSAIEKGITRYNFLGISGVFDGSDGVLKFKQSFSGNVEEKLGKFTLVLHPAKYKLYSHLKNLTDKIRG